MGEAGLDGEARKASGPKGAGDEPGGNGPPAAPRTGRYAPELRRARKPCPDHLPSGPSASVQRATLTRAATPAFLTPRVAVAT